MDWINRPWVSALFVIAKCVDIQVFLQLERCSFYWSNDPCFKTIRVFAGNLILLHRLPMQHKYDTYTFLAHDHTNLFFSFSHMPVICFWQDFLFFCVMKHAHPSCLLESSVIVSVYLYLGEFVCYYILLGKGSRGSIGSHRWWHSYIYACAEQNTIEGRMTPDSETRI